MPIIQANTGVITQINVFTVPENGQQPLIDFLAEAAAACRDAPGWMSASLHRSLDGTRVVNYAQTRDFASWEAVMRKLKAGRFLERNKAFGTADPGLYEVIRTIER